jgi:NEDD8-activating enzyme E1
MYTGNESIYTYTFEHQQKPECPVCGGESTEVTRPQESTLQDLIDYLLEKQDLYVPLSFSPLLPPVLAPLLRGAEPS